MKINRGFLYCGMLGACTLPGVLQAQNAQNAGASIELEEIVVTANKRAESAQSVAAAIVAVDPSTLARSGVKDFENINKVLPDVKVDTVIGGTNIAIRGIRSSSVSPTTDGPAAVHIDGVYLVRTGGLSGFMYDLQRIESLPGPQGTLYGRNATSGVINLVPNRPTNEAGGSIEVEGGSQTTQRIDGVINVPVNDMVALRTAAHMYRRDGYYANGLSDADQTGARLSALFTFTDRLSLLVSGDYESNKDHGVGNAVVGSVNGAPAQGPPGTPAPSSAGFYTVPTDPFRDNRILYPLGVGTSGNSSRLHGFMAQLDYDLGWSVLTTQYGARTTSLLSDNVNLSNYNPVVNPAPPARGSLPTTVGHVISPSHSSTDSAEVRLASKDTEQFKYVTGLFYFHETASSDFCQLGSLAVTAISQTNCSQLYIKQPYQFTRSYSVFGDATYTPSFLEALHLTGGVRYNNDNKSGESLLLSLNPILDTVVKDLKFTKTTYKANVSFDVAPSNLVYAQYSTGFRAGGIAYGSSAVYQPETIKAIEIGSKNRFLNDRLQVNLTAFDYRYENVLNNVIRLGVTPTGGFGLVDITVTNIGKVHYQGGSILSAYALTADDRIDLNLQFLKGRYDDYQLPARFVATVPLGPNGVPTGENGSNLTGLDVPNVAPWSGTFAYEHSFHFGESKVDARVASQFSAETHAGAQATFKDSIQYSSSRIPSYARFDVSLTYAPNSDRWHVTGYMNNVADKVTYATSGYEGQNNTSSGLVIASLLPPRTFGVIVGAQF